MLRNSSYFLLLLAGGALLLSPAAAEDVAPTRKAAPQAPSKSARELVKENSPVLATNPYILIEAAKETMKGVNDFTCIVTKRERIGGTLQPQETILLKSREKPFSIYAKWITGKKKGQEALFVQGKNKNKVIAHFGGLQGLFGVFKVDPNSSLARKYARHPITEVGFSHMLKSLTSVCERAKRNGDLKLIYVGEKKLADGVVARGLVRILPKKNCYPCHIMFFYLDEKTLLPARLVQLDWDYLLLDSYTFSHVRVNQGLTDKDFDPNNRQYNLHMRLLPFFP